MHRVVMTTDELLQVIDMKNSVRQKGKTSEFECSDAPLVKWDKTNGDYSPRNGAMRNAQRFVDMWQLYVPDVPIHSKTKTYHHKKLS